MIKYDGGVAGAELSLKHPVNGITYLEYNMARSVGGGGGGG